MTEEFRKKESERVQRWRARKIAEIGIEAFRERQRIAYRERCQRQVSEREDVRPTISMASFNAITIGIDRNVHPHNLQGENSHDAALMFFGTNVLIVREIVAFQGKACTAAVSLAATDHNGTAGMLARNADEDADTDDLKGDLLIVFN